MFYKKYLSEVVLESECPVLIIIRLVTTAPKMSAVRW